MFVVVAILFHTVLATGTHGNSCGYFLRFLSTNICQYCFYAENHKVMLLTSRPFAILHRNKIFQGAQGPGPQTEEVLEINVKTVIFPSVMKPDVAAPGLIHVSNNLKYSSILIKNFFIPRGVGTGETGEAHASPEIRGCLKSNIQIGKKKKRRAFFFLVLHLKLYCSYAPVYVVCI